MTLSQLNVVAFLMALGVVTLSAIHITCSTAGLLLFLATTFQKIVVATIDDGLQSIYTLLQLEVC